VKLHVLNILEILPVACSSLHDMYRWYIVHVFVKNVRVTSFTCVLNFNIFIYYYILKKHFNIKPGV